MDYVIVLAVSLAIAAIVCGGTFVHWLRTRRTTHDDLVRVGDGPDVTPYDASRRAEGDGAWTRISGGV